MTRIFLCLFLSLYLNCVCILSTKYQATNTLRSSNNADLIVSIDDETDLVTITLTVDSDIWVGAGFGSTTMPNTYSVIAYGTTSVQERKLASDAKGTQLTSELTTVSDTTANSIRTLVVTRSITIADSDYYDFSSIGDGTQVNIIWGVGSGTSFSKHASKGSKTLSFSEVSPTEDPTNAPSNEPTTPSMMPSSNPTRANTDAPTGVPATTTEQPVSDEVVSFSFESNEGATYDVSCDMSIYEDSSIVFTLGGPAGQWIGFGFGASVMDGTYSIIVDGNNNVEQRILGDWEEGHLLNSSETSDFTVLSIDEDDDTWRYIEITQSMENLYFDFSGYQTETSLDYIMASSESVSLETHDWKQIGTSTATQDSDSGDNSGVTSNIECNVAIMIVGMIAAVLCVY